MADEIIGGCCNPDNSLNPQQPEYGKKIKPENNNGCGCPYGSSTAEAAAEPTIIIQQLTRGDFA